MIDLQSISAARDEAIQTFMPWKTDIQMVDRISAGDWDIMWPDRSKEHSKPHIENIYNQALEDKMAAAGGTLPSLFVAPRQGTRSDRAESQAQRRRRVMHSYWERSNLDRELKAYARDWLHAGASYMMPWLNWKHPDGSMTMPYERYPFLLRVDPRQAYPLGHAPNGELATCLIIRTRRVADIAAEWGDNHPAVEATVRWQALRKASGKGHLGWVEEIYWYDQTQWAVAIMDSNMPPLMQQNSTWVPNPQFGTPLREWLVEPEHHMLFGCPVTESKRIPTESNDGYRGALIDIVPVLETAQHFRAYILDDLVNNIYAPVVLDNVEDYDQYGPGAVLQGTGDGEARILRDRTPTNFEGENIVGNLLEGIRRDAFEPPQRSGTFGASIASAKGVNAVQGTWNAELAWQQTDISWMLRRSTSMAACLDEKWAPGDKSLSGWEDGNRAYHETYDSAKVFAGDYQCMVSYGDRTGLDQQNHMVFVATAKQLNLITDRDATQRLFPDQDVLQMERDMAIEKMVKLFIDGVLPQQIQGGDLSGFAAMIEALDDDKVSVRAAAMKVARDLGMIPPADGSGVPPGPAPAPDDPMAMLGAAAAGGIPGSSPNLPMPGGDLRRALPSGVQRRLQEAG